MSADNKSPGAGRDYAVGYGKPPVATRFQRGQSGNPKGRQRGSQNLRTAISRELDVVVTVIENGKRMRKRKRDIIAAQLVNKSAGADWRAMTLLLPRMDQDEHERFALQAQVADRESWSEADAAVLASLRERLKQGEPIDD